jgi:hypothetical protein
VYQVYIQVCGNGCTKGKTKGVAKDSRLNFQGCQSEAHIEREDVNKVLGGVMLDCMYVREVKFFVRHECKPNQSNKQSWLL